MENVFTEERYLTLAFRRGKKVDLKTGDDTTFAQFQTMAGDLRNIIERFRELRVMSAATDKYDLPIAGAKEIGELAEAMVRDVAAINASYNLPGDDDYGKGASPLELQREEENE